MTAEIIIPESLEGRLQAHLFQNRLEQGAFLFTTVSQTAERLALTVEGLYLVPPEGWHIQAEEYLEMKDSERAKIMKQARDGNFAVVDCHSHPRATDDVWFSPSDRDGTAEFAAYARWKLDGKPYVATVWGRSSTDAVLWQGDFTQPQRVDAIRVVGERTRTILPRGSWFRAPRFPRGRTIHGR